MSDSDAPDDTYLAQTGFASTTRGDRGPAPEEDEILIEERRAGAADEGVDAHESPVPTAAEETPEEAAERARLEEADVEKVVERLTERFSDVPLEVVEETVTEIHESMEDAAVRDFVPRIVEHDARDRLREVEEEIEGSSADEAPAAR